MSKTRSQAARDQPFLFLQERHAAMKELNQAHFIRLFAAHPAPRHAPCGFAVTVQGAPYRLQLPHQTASHGRGRAALALPLAAWCRPFPLPWPWLWRPHDPGQQWQPVNSRTDTFSARFCARTISSQRTSTLPSPARNALVHWESGRHSFATTHSATTDVSISSPRRRIARST